MRTSTEPVNSQPPASERSDIPLHWCGVCGMQYSGDPAKHKHHPR